MSISKSYRENSDLCAVTFRLSKEDTNGALQVHVVGEFNGWDIEATPMKATKKGGFTKTLNFKKGQVYQFRYLLNGNLWINDPDADKYVPSPFEDAQNCFISI